MMQQSKMKIKESEENGVGPTKRSSSTSSSCVDNIDHWAFLEEIEAPMWADLTLEANLSTEDNDDAWFHTSHPFHHHSARYLRSAFAHPDVSNDLFNFNPRGPCSPKLPSSVSKSRGKDYKSRDWKGDDRICISKGHPVNDLDGKVPRLDAGPSQKCKSKVSPESQSEVSSSITSVICNDRCTVTASSSSQVVAKDGDTRGAVNFQSASTSGVSTSTITTIGHGRDSKLWGVSKEGFGQTGGLLNALKTNLRKSCATRPASRVEICGDREVKGRKSSSGKSSVGSSSIGCDVRGKTSAILPKTDHVDQTKVNKNPSLRGLKSSVLKANVGFSNPKLEVKKVTAGSKQNKDLNSNVRGLGKSAQAVYGRVKATKVIEASSKNKADVVKQIQSRCPKDGDVGRAKSWASVNSKSVNNSKKENRDAAPLSTRVEAAKSKNLLQHATNRNQPKVKSPGTKGKAGKNLFNESAVIGKENIRGGAVSRQKSVGKYNQPVVRASEKRIPLKLISENKVGRVTSVGSKVKIHVVDDKRLQPDTPVYLKLD